MDRLRLRPNKRCHDRVRAARQRVVELGRRCAEAGAFEQLGGAFASSKRLGDKPQIVDPFDRYDCGIALRRRCGAAMSEQHTEQPSKRCHPDASHG